MTESQTYLINKLNKLKQAYPNSYICYIYDKFINYHIIEIDENLIENYKYRLIEKHMWSEFTKLFTNEYLIITKPEDPRYDMFKTEDNIVFKTH